MRKILFVALLLLVPAACQHEKMISTLPDAAPDQQMGTSEGGVTLTLEKTSYTDPTPEIKITLHNESDHDYQYGDFYHIEVLKDGQWYMITYSDAVFLKNKSFTDSGHILPAYDEARQTFLVEALGVELSPGQYRLVKTFLSRSDTFQEYAVAAPFTVE